MTHAVAMLTRLVRGHLCSVFVELALVHAADRRSLSCQQTRWNSSGSFLSAVVSRGAAAGPGEHGRATIHVEFAVLQHAGAAVADAVAHLARLLGVPGHSRSLRVVLAVDVASCPFIGGWSFCFRLVEGGRYRHMRPQSVWPLGGRTGRAGDVRAALAGPLCHRAVVAQLLYVGTHAQVAHEHAAHARAVQARLVRLDLLAVFVVLQHEVATPITWRPDF